jgi:hypothetical protein
VEPALRPALAAALARIGKRAQDFTDTETWAAALTLARAEAAGDPANGVDRALLATTALPVAELEGATGQLGLFDACPKRPSAACWPPALPMMAPTRWRWPPPGGGDIALIAQQTTPASWPIRSARGALHRAQPRLERTITAPCGRAHPFVAVGAAHMAGDDALPACWPRKAIASRGWNRLHSRRDAAMRAPFPSWSSLEAWRVYRLSSVFERQVL